MTTKQSTKKCAKLSANNEQRQLSVYMPIPLFHRVKASAEQSKRSMTKQIIFLLEGVLPPIEELEAAATSKTNA